MSTYYMASLGLFATFLLGCPPAQPPAAGTPAGTPATASGTAAPAATGIDTDDGKTLYALGLDIARNIDVFSLTPAELEIMKQGLTDGVTGAKPKVELEVWGPRIGDLARARDAARTEQEKQRSVEYLPKQEAEPGAKKTPSGLIYFETQAGTGATPTAADVVKVHYKGTLVDGTEFDSSYKRNEPAEFPLGGVIPCWSEGIQLMKVGGKGTLGCPAALASGDGGAPPRIRGGATLTFEVELLDIVKADEHEGHAHEAPPATPEPAAAPAPEAAPAPAPAPTPAQ